jgi:hypothetical protein
MENNINNISKEPIDPHKGQEPPEPLKDGKGRLNLTSGVSRAVSFLTSGVKSVIPESFAAHARLFANEVAYEAASILRLKKRHQLSTDVMHRSKDVEDIHLKKKYGDKLIAPTRNIAKRDVLKTEKDKDRAIEILNKLRENKASTKNLQYVVAEKDPEHSVRDGICMGLTLHAAEQYLNEGKSIEVIAESLAKGSEADAAANQAVYQAIGVKLPNSLTLINKAMENIRYLELSQKTMNKDDLNEISFAAIHLTETNQEHKGDFFNLIKEIQDLLPKNFNESDLENFEEKVYSKINVLYNKNSETLERNDAEATREKHIRQWETLKTLLEIKLGYNHFHQKKPAPKSRLSKPLSPLWQQVKDAAVKLFGRGEALPVVGGSSETIIDHVSDEELRLMIKIKMLHVINKQKAAPIAEYRNCKFENVKGYYGCIGSSKTDDEFLSHLKDLSAGVYSIDFNVKGGAHATAYFQNDDGSGTFFDPNFGFFKCKDPGDAARTIKELLQNYPEPSSKRPNLPKGKTDHHMRISQIKLKDS